MIEDKNSLKKELFFINKIDEKINYDDIEDVETMYQAVLKKNMFATSEGQQYIEKLKEIIQKKSTGTCLFCNRKPRKNSVICSRCFKKLPVTWEEENTKSGFGAYKKVIAEIAAVVLIACLILVGVSMAPKEAEEGNVLAYLGTSQEEIFEDYTRAYFYEDEMGFLTNEGYIEQGKPYVSLSENGSVYNVILVSNMDASWNVEGVHIGDDFSSVEKKMKAAKAVYDTELSVSDYFECYSIDYGKYKVSIIFIGEDGVVTRISCTTDDVK